MGQLLYGYTAARGSSGSVSERSAASRRAAEESDTAWAEAEGEGGAAARLLTQAHVEFFVCFGFVVVEGAVEPEVAGRVAREVASHLDEKYGIQLTNLESAICRSGRSSSCRS